MILNEDDAYESLLSLAQLDTDVVDLVRAIAAGVADADELMERWHREHVTNGAGRIEGRVYEETPGVWVADPQTGFADPRKFDSEKAARVWITTGGHYQHPDGKEYRP